MRTQMSPAELKRKLGELDSQMMDLGMEIESIQYEIEALAKKRKALARRHCPHSRTYQRSVMGKEIEICCKLCGEEV